MNVYCTHYHEPINIQKCGKCPKLDSEGHCDCSMSEEQFNIERPDLTFASTTNNIKHPAKYSDQFLPIFAKILIENKCLNVYDPMAGTGKLAMIKAYGYNGIVICNDLEADWNDLTYPVNYWSHYDAANPNYPEGSFSAICTSPTYGNRLADHWKRKEFSKRFSYFFNLGHDLHPENTGSMHWGDKYRIKHIKIWKECVRVLKPNGIFILNISDHIRNKELQEVSQWHKDILTLECGLIEESDQEIPTKRLRYGQNSESRVYNEHIIVFRKARDLQKKHRTGDPTP
jgi:SAM-dependent methyltransferase